MAEKGFILKNIKYASFAKPGVPSEYADERIDDYFDETRGKYWSFALCRSGTNQNTWINPTGVPGYVMNIYYSLMFELPKDLWEVVKKDETIDVTPVHHQYYQITHGQKEALEARIREGLVKISQSIADLELVHHDMLKYEDFEKKMAERGLNPEEKGISPEEKKSREEKKKAAEMELKTTFVDEVDFHAGGGAQGAGRLSMAFMRNNNIMPTIVDDFFRMKSKDDLEKDPSIKNIPTVEKRMLEVKWNAYQDWLGYFTNNVKRRMDALRTLLKSREKTLDEYREWLKPAIARYKMITDSLERASDRKSAYTMRLRTSGVATSYNSILLWFWKEFQPPEPHRVPQELIEKSGVRAIGKWEYENFYFHPDHGLVIDYPWITKEWIDAVAGIDDDGNAKNVKGMKEGSWYYSFMTMTLDRTNIKTSATGAEIEDGDYKYINYMVSKNVLAAKFLELKAHEEELEIYIDDVLGLAHKVKGMPVVIYEKIKGKCVVDDKQYGAIKKFRFMTDTTNPKTEIKLPDMPAGGEFASEKEMKAAFPKNKDGDLLVMFIERKKESEFLNGISKTLGIGNIRFFLPSGPYEQNFNERIKKIYLKPNSARFEYVGDFIKGKMNIGGGT